jgi:hypothetical protein
MCEELASAGRTRWTARLTLLPDGIEFANSKKPGVEPRVIPYSQVGQWEVDQGLFKLALEGSSKPDIVEKTHGWNFYPGLVLFTRLVDAPGSHSALFAGFHFSA